MLLELVGGPQHDEATAAQVRELVTKGALGGLFLQSSDVHATYAALRDAGVEITQEPGGSFLDRMIALVEGAARRKTPNEVALGILLAGLSIVFLIVVVTLRPFVTFSGDERAVRPFRAGPGTTTGPTASAAGPVVVGIDQPKRPEM